MRMFRAPLAALVLLGALAVPAAASGPDFVDVGDGRISPSDRSTVLVPVTIQCTSNTTPNTGTATLTLTQEYRGTTVTGTGQTEVICDGQARDYLITVTSGDGTFRKGAATATTTVAFPLEMCISDPDGNTECQTFVMTMRTEESIALRVGGPAD